MENETASLFCCNQYENPCIGGVGFRKFKKIVRQNKHFSCIFPSYVQGLLRCTMTFLRTEKMIFFFFSLPFHSNCLKLYSKDRETGIFHPLVPLVHNYLQLLGQGQAEASNKALNPAFQQVQVPRFCAVFCCFPKPQLGSWMGSRGAWRWGIEPSCWALPLFTLKPVYCLP